MTRGRARIWLIPASLGFWLAWLLMPGVGVTDPARIFELVASHRPQVHASVVLQLVSAAAYVSGAFWLALAHPSSRAVRIGSLLLAIGAAGSAADAIFHLVAYEMTAPGVPVRDLMAVMARLQGPDLGLLLPFVVVFFVGHAVLVIACRKRGLRGRLALGLLVAAPLAAIGCGLGARAGVLARRAPGLVFLGLLAASLIVASLAPADDGDRQAAAA